MAKPSILYCGNLAKENVYRYFTSDKKAIAGFKRLAIKKHTNLTDMSKKVDGKWTRIRY